MITAYSVSDGRLGRLDCSHDQTGLDGAIWIDLLDPTRAQEQIVETLLQVEIPTREEMRSIDESSQIFRDGDALVMTARVLSRGESNSPVLVHVTFILVHGRLVTLRYGDPSPFRNFVARAGKDVANLNSGLAVMVGLLEAIIDRAAEILQTAGGELEALSTDIFTRDGSVSGSGNHADLRPVLQQIGRTGDLAGRVRESLHSLGRIVPYLQSAKPATRLAAATGPTTTGPTTTSDDDIPMRLNTVARDVASLLDHDGYLMSKVTFLLDATLGLINIQQNAIIKIFSVAAVIFLPATLIASIYGMNFANIPELHWQFGYPYALGLMLASAILPYFFFKRRGWL
jgi:magnesium transporter